MKWAGGGGAVAQFKAMQGQMWFCGGWEGPAAIPGAAQESNLPALCFPVPLSFIQPIIPLKGLILLPRYNVFCLDSVFHLLFLPGLAVFQKLAANCAQFQRLDLWIRFCIAQMVLDEIVDQIVTLIVDRIVRPPPKFGLPRLPLPRRTRAPGKSGGR